MPYLYLMTWTFSACLMLGGAFYAGRAVAEGCKACALTSAILLTGGVISSGLIVAGVLWGP